MIHTNAADEARWNRVRLRQTLVSIAALWAVIGLIVVIAGAVEYGRARVVAGWTPVEGVVEAVAIERVERRGRVPFFVPSVRVEYSYSFDGRAYTSDRVAFDRRPIPPDSDDGRRLLALAPGASIPVTVNPAAPAEAVLLRDSPTRALINGAALLGLAGVIGLLAKVVRVAE